MTWCDCRKHYLRQRTATFGSSLVRQYWIRHRALAACACFSLSVSVSKYSIIPSIAHKSLCVCGERAHALMSTWYPAVRTETELSRRSETILSRRPSLSKRSQPFAPATSIIMSRLCAARSRTVSSPSSRHLLKAPTTPSSMSCTQVLTVARSSCR